MQVAMSIAIMQVLRLYCNYTGGTFCYSYVITEIFFLKIIFGGETLPIHFSEELKLNISLYQQTKVLYSLFLLCAKLRGIKIY